MKMRNVLLLVTPSSPGRLAGVARFARSHGWHLTVADRLTHALDGWTGDGALVTLRDDEAVIRHVQSLRRRRIPVVDLSLTRPDIRLPRVAGDNAAMGRAAAAHFRDRYFSNAAWFSTGWGHQHELRFGAFADAMKKPPQRWAWALDDGRTKSDDWKSLSRWLEAKLRAATRPLAVFCFDDADASRVESAAMATGLAIPDDVAILGTGDDVPLCESQIVPISSVRHNLERNGYAGAALLERLMDKGRAPRSPILVSPVGIAERASTNSLALSSPLVKGAAEIYLSDLAHAPSTEMLAERLGVSRATLDRAFSADIATPPAKLLSRLRLERSKELLKDGRLTIAEIAYSLGYCNPAYFSNVFKAAYGVLPRKARKIGAR